MNAFNAHDAAAVGELMTSDVEYVYWHDDAWMTIRGRDSVIDLLDDLDKEWSSDFRLRATFAVVNDDGFAVEYDETGTQDRGADPSERRFVLRNVMVGEFRAGRISRMTDYSDVTAYRAQVGPD